MNNSLDSEIIGEVHVSPETDRSNVGLAEVRIDRGIEHQAVFDHHLGIKAGLGLHVLAGKAGSGRIALSTTMARLGRGK